MTFIGLFFGALVVAAIVSMAKIQRQKLLDAREAKRKETERIEGFRDKCYRPESGVQGHVRAHAEGGQGAKPHPPRAPRTHGD